jgi:hypothetical protein
MQAGFQMSVRFRLSAERYGRTCAIERRVNGAGMSDGGEVGAFDFSENRHGGL